MTRVRQARLLAWPLVRTVPWLSLPGAGVVGIGVLSLDGPTVLKLRFAAIALCAAAAFALDDRAADLAAVSPTPLLFRRALRVALVLGIIAALWGLVLWYAGDGFHAGLTLELAAMLAVTLAAAAVAAPFTADGRGGIVAGPALLTLLATAALALPDSWTLFAPGSADPRWAASQQRWGAILAVALLTLAGASRDLCRPPLLDARVSRWIRSGGRIQPLTREETP